MQEYNEQTPILQAKIKYVTELDMDAIKNKTLEERQITINNINNQRKEVIQNINNELKIYKEKILLTRNLIAQDYVNDNNIIYNNEYGDYETFIKYVNKVINCITEGGVIIDKNNNWSIRLWYYKNNYNFDNLFDKKDRKHDLIKYHGVKPNYEQKKEIFINNLKRRDFCHDIIMFMLVSSAFICYIGVPLMISLIPAFIIGDMSVFFTIIKILLCLTLCLIVLYFVCCVSIFMISYTLYHKYWELYYKYEKKREKYYNIIGKNNMDLLIELNDQYEKLINTNN